MSQKQPDPNLEKAHAWLESVSLKLDQDPAVIRELMMELLDLTRDVAHGPSRPAAPLTTFLLGLATGRALGPETGADTGTEAAVFKSRENIARVLELLEKL